MGIFRSIFSYFFIVPYVNAVPDYLFRYKLNNTDPSVTPINSPALVDGPALNDRKGLLFNGIDQGARADPDSALLALGTGPFSFSAWIKTSIGLGTMVVLRNGSGIFDDAFSFEIRLSKITFRVNLIFFESITAINDNKWHLIAVTCSGSGGTMKIYIDDALDKSGAATTYNLVEKPAVAIAYAALVGVQHFDGPLDDIRCYNRELSLPEIELIYNERVVA